MMAQIAEIVNRNLVDPNSGKISMWNLLICSKFFLKDNCPYEHKLLFLLIEKKNRLDFQFRIRIIAVVYCGE